MSREPGPTKPSHYVATDAARPSSAAPFPLPSKLARNLSQRGGLVETQLRASNDHGFIVGVPRARRNHEPAPSHPLRRILLPRFFFCKPLIQGRQDHQRECR